MALWGLALDREAASERAWRVVAPSISEIGGSQPIDVDTSLSKD